LAFFFIKKKKERIDPAFAGIPNGHVYQLKIVEYLSTENEYLYVLV